MNPTGKPKPVDQEEMESLRERVAELEQRARDAAALEVDAGGGVITSERMRKVWRQDGVMDVGPTERRLREWLTKDVSKYEERMRELQAEEEGIAEMRAELVRLRAENAEWRAKKEREAADEESEDEGTARALALMDSILAGTHMSEDDECMAIIYSLHQLERAGEDQSKAAYVLRDCYDKTYCDLDARGKKQMSEFSAKLRKSKSDHGGEGSDR